MLEYERIMHKVALDIPIYGSRYIKANTDSLKMLPFEHEVAPYPPKLIQSPAELLSNEYNMNDYYHSSVALDVLKHIRDAIHNRFAISQVWNREKLI